MATKNSAAVQTAAATTDGAGADGTSAQTAADAVAKATPAVDAAPVVLPAESVVKTDKGSYIVASPIKHDGEDYAPGDTIRLPEAVAHRLAGYLEA